MTEAFTQLMRRSGKTRMIVKQMLLSAGYDDDHAEWKCELIFDKPPLLRRWWNNWKFERHYPWQS